MLPLSRMKSLLSPVLSRPTIMFVCRGYGVLSTFKNLNSAQTMNPMSKVSSLRCSTVQNHSQIRVLSSEASGSNSGSGSGEVHVIVGPMFAGKTTTLLKRIKSERSNGRLVLSICFSFGCVMKCCAYLKFKSFYTIHLLE